MKDWTRRGITILLLTISFALLIFGNILKIKGTRADMTMYDSLIRESEDNVNMMWAEGSRDMRIHYLESINQHRFSWSEVNGIFRIYDERMNYVGSETIANVGKVFRLIAIVLFLLSLFMIVTQKRLGPVLYTAVSIMLAVYFLIVERKVHDFIHGWIDDFGNMDLHIGLTAEMIISILLAVLASVVWFVLKDADRTIPKMGSVSGSDRSMYGLSKKATARGYNRKVSRFATEDLNAIKCGNCGRRLNSGAVFCPSCGMKYVPPVIVEQTHDDEKSKVRSNGFCTKCGAMLDNDAIFCGECGTRIN